MQVWPKNLLKMQGGHDSRLQSDPRQQKPPTLPQLPEQVQDPDQEFGILSQ